MASFGQDWFKDLACSVNCVGRVKQPLYGARQPDMLPPRLEAAEEQATAEEEAVGIPKAISSRLAVAEEFVKCTWNSFEFYLQDDQCSTEESASSSSFPHEGLSDDGSAPLTVKCSPRFSHAQEGQEIATVEERWLLHWKVLIERAMEMDCLALQKEAKAEMHSRKAGKQDTAVECEAPAQEESVQEPLVQQAESVQQPLVEPAPEEMQKSVSSPIATLDDFFKEDFFDENFSEEFWGPADFHSARGLENAALVSSLLRFRVVRHGDLAGASVLPWQRDISRELYWEMGMRDSKSRYVATWLNCHKVSLLMVSKVVDEEWLQRLTVEDALRNRLKLVLRPVRAKIPFPVRAAPDADTIGSYFGAKSSSLTLHHSSNGIHHLCVQVDLYSKWQLRLAMQKVGFREGNILELLVVDWPGQAVLSSCQLNVTQELLKLIA